MCDFRHNDRNETESTMCFRAQKSKAIHYGRKIEL